MSLLPAVEPDDARHDLPPIMLTDGDMDPNMRMLLEWRVGTKVDKAKEMGMVTRCDRLGGQGLHMMLVVAPNSLLQLSDDAANGKHDKWETWKCGNGK